MDIEAKGYAPVVLRYALTSGAYRQTINFTMDSLNAANSALQRLRKFSDELLSKSGQKRAAILKLIAKGKQTETSWGIFTDAWNTLANDLNIPGALGHIFSTIKTAKLDDLNAEELNHVAIAFHKLIFALGYDLDQVVIEKPKVEAPEEIKVLAQQRWDAKQAKDWAAADELRAHLTEKGWSIKDSKDGYELEKL